MQGVLITDGGPHSPSKWAEATASHIVSIANHVSGTTRGAAIKLQAAIIDILEGHHTSVQHGERQKIADVGHNRINHVYDVAEHVNIPEIINEIVAAAVGTPWEADFKYPGQLADPLQNILYIASFAENLDVLLHAHFRTSMHIERSWHADRHPETKQAKAFRSIHHPGV